MAQHVGGLTGMDMQQAAAAIANAVADAELPAAAAPSQVDTPTPSVDVAAPAEDGARVAEQCVFNVTLSSGKSYELTAEATDLAAVLMRALAEVHEVPPTCNVKMFQSGQLLLEDTPVSGLDAEQPVFAVISRETKVEILLQAAASYTGYADSIA